MFTCLPMPSTSSRTASWSPSMLRSKAAIRNGLILRIVRSCHSNKDDGTVVNTLPFVEPATRSLADRSTSTTPLRAGWRKEAADERAFQYWYFACRAHQTIHGRAQDAARHRGPGYHSASHRAGRDHRDRGHRFSARGGTDAAREPAHQDRSRHGPALHHQDTRRLRL